MKIIGTIGLVLFLGPIAVGLVFALGAAIYEVPFIGIPATMMIAGLVCISAWMHCNTPPIPPDIPLPAEMIDRARHG